MVWESAAGPIGSALIGGGFSAFGQSRANREMRDAARDARQFSERMFRNRYRYTMADMKAAGLNPILAYQQGGGAAPAGVSATAGNIFEGAADQLGKGVSSALAATRMKHEIKLLKEQATATKAQGYYTDAQSAGQYLTNKLLQWQETNAKASAAGATHYLNMLKSPAGKYLKGIEAIGRAINPGASAFSNLRR